MRIQLRSVVGLFSCLCFEYMYEGGGSGTCVWKLCQVASLATLHLIL